MGVRVADLGSGREAEFLLYQIEEGRTRMEAHSDDRTFWPLLGQTTALPKLNGSPAEGRLMGRDV